LGTLLIGGNVTGGTVENTGEILATGNLTNLHIAGNLTGGSGAQSGSVSVGGALGTLLIGGNVTGGTADNTGEIFSVGNLTTATIHGNLAGNGATPINSATAVVGAGYLQAGHIGTLDIMGSVTSGTNMAGPGLIANSGAIRSASDILSLTIDGPVTGVAGNPVIISAQQGPGTSAHLTSDLAIGSVTVHGAVSYLDLLAGYSPTVSTISGSTTNPAGAPLGTPTDGAAQMGTLNFSTLSASNLVAGATPDSSGQFGTTGTTAIAPRSGAFGVLSTIAKIIVAGVATGDSTPGDSFGIVAQHFGIMEVNGSGNIIPGANLIPGMPSAVNGTNLFLLEPLP
jgi:hypothetical protein